MCDVTPLKCKSSQKYSSKSKMLDILLNELSICASLPPTADDNN